MNALIASPVVRSILRAVLVWAPLWIFTTILFGGLGVAYVVVLKQNTYLASQALLVRDEATGAVMRLGRFQSQAEMKAAQETILEMAKSQQVVHDALTVVHPPAESSFWPTWSEASSSEPVTKEMVEEFAKTISVHAPKGTEFGVTEVIYLDVKAHSQDEAMRISAALTEALESRLQQIRRARADGVLSELTLARDSAKIELTNSTAKLHDIESAAGSDLSDLRGMTDSIAGGATARAEFDQSKNELRQAEINLQSLLADREMLIRATMDPTSFIVAPGTVLTSQPGLKRLREGLVDAQLAGSQLTGKFTESHPSVIASQSSQNSIVTRFLEELKASIGGVESDIALVEGRIKRLELQKNTLQDRLAKLADSRAPYANLLSEVKSKVAILEAAERELAEVQAARDSSVSTSLLTRLDAPMVSDRPIGPGKTTITGLCTIAGLIFGLGIVFVITPIDSGPSFGRRNQDRVLGRRDADLIASNDSSIVPKTTSESGATAKTVRPQTELRGVASALQEESRLHANYQSIAKPSRVNPEQANNAPRASTPTDIEEIDQTFQELSRLQSQKPSNRSEEFTLQMKMQDLKDVLSRQSVPNNAKDNIESIDNREHTPLSKPRQMKLERPV